MAGVKPRTPTSSAHQIYGEVTAKICYTLFCKRIDIEIFTKIWRKITQKERHVYEPHFVKMHEPKFLVLSRTVKIIGCTICSQCMHSYGTGYELSLDA